MSFRMCSSEAMMSKAGNEASSEAISSGVLMSEWCDVSEGQIIARTRLDWFKNFDGLASGARLALSDACSDLGGMKIINYDPNVWSLATAQTKLDMLRDNSTKIINDLKDFKSNTIKTP